MAASSGRPSGTAKARAVAARHSRSIVQFATDAASASSQCRGAIERDANRISKPMITASSTTAPTVSAGCAFQAVDTPRTTTASAPVVYSTTSPAADIADPAGRLMDMADLL
ncbi:MAG: hypothetical protein GEU86_09370 [Actinophytocola sp.]|nr:hypothetical protein [Actinophytocola sp.]